MTGFNPLVFTLVVLGGIAAVALFELIASPFKRGINRGFTDYSSDQIAHGDHPFVPTINQPRGD